MLATQTINISMERWGACHGDFSCHSLLLLTLRSVSSHEVYYQKTTKIIAYGMYNIQRIQDSRAETTVATANSQHPNSTPREIGGKHLRKACVQSLPAIIEFFPNRYESVKERLKGIFQLPYRGCPNVGLGGPPGSAVPSTSE